MAKKTKCIIVQYPYNDEKGRGCGWGTDDPDWNWYPVFVEIPSLPITIEEILEAVQHHFLEGKLIPRIEAVEDLPIPALEAKRQAFDIMCLAADTDRFKHIELNSSCFWPPYQAAEYIWKIIQANAAVDIKQATEPTPISANATEPTPDKKTKQGKEALALAALLKNPEWTNTKIAETIGVYRTTLYKYASFKAAKDVLKREGKASMPGGSRDEDGNVEAWERDS